MFYYNIVTTQPKFCDGHNSDKTKVSHWRKKKVGRKKTKQMYIKVKVNNNNKQPAGDLTMQVEWELPNKPSPKNICKISETYYLNQRHKTYAIKKKSRLRFG